MRAGGELHTGDWRLGAPPPEHADPGAGFAPLGAVVEAGATGYAWPLRDRDALWADDVGELVEQASAQQWDASRDIPWEAARGLRDEIERAVAQVMTFIAQNEYAALYVPAGFLRTSTRSSLSCCSGSAATSTTRPATSRSSRSARWPEDRSAMRSPPPSCRCSTLLEERDFTASSLLLNVLGEGTFLDLLKFVGAHAPDAATAVAARLAHRDERRHVHFGVSHIRRATDRDPELRGALVAAAEARAAKLVSLSGLSPVLLESLTILSADSLQPAELGEAAAQVRHLTRAMERNRIRRLRACGFDERPHATSRTSTRPTSCDRDSDPSRAEHHPR